ncbi:MAG TPA: S8 family serine peptidase, partial [bacterium]|nr:S8 family serine peptidase [bacterium]
MREKVSAALLCLAIAFVLPDAFAGEVIRLNASVFDPLEQRPETSSTFAVPKAFHEKNQLWLVQFHQSPTAEDIKVLEGNGISVLGYIPDDVYLVLSSVGMPEIGDARVRWVGAYQPAFKMQSELAKALETDYATESDTTGDRASVVIQVPRYADYEKKIRPVIEAAGGTVSRDHGVGKFVNVRAEIPLNQIPAVASEPYVIWIEKEPERQLKGERACLINTGEFSSGFACPTQSGYAQWLNQYAVNGFGIIAHIADDGLDRGIDTNQPGTAHPDILGRIAKAENLTTDPSGDSRGGHGQINCGIIMGNATLGAKDKDGFLLGMGMAPSAWIYSSKIFRNSGAFSMSKSFSEMLDAARQTGAVVSSNSWGADIQGVYNTDSQEYDYLVRDAANGVVGNQGMTCVFAAGNDGARSTSTNPHGYQTLDAPASAKNVIAVGASENCDADGVDACGHGPDSADNTNHLTSFTSRGPAADGRLGVTLVAPGTHINGPASTGSDFDGSSVCGFWPTNQSYYVRSTGTSHSTPLVTGAAVLFYDKYMQQSASEPSPALVKAALVNGCSDMQGGLDSLSFHTISPIPDPKQGWGRLNMKNVLSDEIKRIYQDQQVVFVSTGESYTIRVSPVNPAEPLKISLAWTDAPAMTTAAVTLNNDLDLTVQQGSDLWLGNVFQGGRSVQGGVADSLNNLECVYIQNPSGRYEVTVTAAKLVADGVPGNGHALDQDFALVISNAAEQSSEGLVLLDQPVYSCQAQMKVIVSDSDIRNATGISVTLSCPQLGDLETLALLEQEVGSGIHEGIISLQQGEPVVGDGFLQVADSVTCTATYRDLDDGNGEIMDVTAQALVDCVAPNISNVLVQELSLDSVRISWETDEPARALLRYGHSCSSASEESRSQALTQNHSMDLMNLDSCSMYYFKLECTDRAGNIALDSNG